MAKKKKTINRDPILAAGGIVTRGRRKPVFAVVRLRRQKSWVLPKGKLNKDETAIAAAKREVIEETGHDVAIQEYLGSLAYVTSGRPKIVKFWRMEASRKPVAKLMKDVSAVRWLPLDQAIRKLTHEREREFLTRFGPQTHEQLQRAKDERSKPQAAPPPAKTPAKPVNGDHAPRRRPSESGDGLRVKAGYSGPKEFVQALWRWLGR
jgi:8-oxo-dGTP diphosphatase